MKKSHKFTTEGILSHWKELGVILFFSTLLCLQLLTNPGRPTTFDGHIHITTMQMFADSLRVGELPAWSQGFGNYGYPLALIAHQLPAYSGAVLILFGIHPELAFKLIIVLSTIASGVGMFAFIHSYLDQRADQIRVNQSALIGAVIWLFSTYRIMNIYSRGAVPELVASALLPFLLLAIVNFFKSYSLKEFLLIFLFSFLLTITHPMMLVLASPLVLAGLLTRMFSQSTKRIALSAGAVLLAVILGVLAASFYVLPLLLELKYFYQGSSVGQISADSYLYLKNMLNWSWPYFPAGDHPGPRIGPIKVGLFEQLVLLAGGASLLTTALRKKSKHDLILIIWIIIALATLMATTFLAKPLYDLLPILSMIQFPWRFLLPFQFATTIIAAILFTKYAPPFKVIALLVCLLIIARLPNIYGKNYISASQTDYQFTRENLHSTNMNPVWVGETAAYPLSDSLFTVAEGAGNLLSRSESPSLRLYVFSGTTSSRIVFNTFYFPGWKLRINGGEREIEYQDPHFRGVMTTRLNPGLSNITLSYEDTKVRLMSKYISATSIFLVGVLALLYVKIQKWLTK
ncbi:hypothetical protein KA012_00165 [Candidatus Woesebacteria bacterium]|nr:hypothetical protein [Candidatus Woesebacteria bacterium]